MRNDIDPNRPAKGIANGLLLSTLVVMAGVVGFLYACSVANDVYGREDLRNQEARSSYGTAGVR